MGGCVGKQHVGASNQENDSETEAIVDTSNDAMKYDDSCTFVDVFLPWKEEKIKMHKEKLTGLQKR